MTTNSGKKVERLSEQLDPDGCESAGCEANAYPYGTPGWGGFVSACALHAPELIDQELVVEAHPG